MDDQESLVQKISGLHEQISNLDSLEPSDTVNHLFTQLVLTCLSPTAIDIRQLPAETQEMRSDLIRLCSEAESLLESHYATLISAFGSPLENLHVFPYFSNYLKLTHQEFTTLSRYQTHTPKRVAFVGSGPLPLTSILLASKYLTKTVFHNYDLDSSANRLAERLVASDPDLSRRMFFQTIDILNVSSELKDFDVVILGALVGTDRESKVRVIEHLAEYMAPGAMLMLRSAHGARAFLYPVVDPSDLREFETLCVFHPTDEVINSIVIAKRYPKSPHRQGFGNFFMPFKCSGEVKVCHPLNHKRIVGELAEEQLS